jgi:hypothetical protein
MTDALSESKGDWVAVRETSNLVQEPRDVAVPEAQEGNAA